MFDLPSTHAPSSRTAQRMTLYLATFFGLSILAVFLRGTSWQSTQEIHMVLELISTLIAFFVGLLTLVQYYTDKNRTFLFVGSGFLGTALFDGYHAAVTSPFLQQWFPSELSSLAPWGWSASRLFFALFIWLSCAFWKESGLKEKSHNFYARKVYTATGLLVLAVGLVFALVPLPSGYFPGFLVGRPEEFLPALFLLLAIYSYLRKGDWTHRQFDHHLILSLIIGFSIQTLFMPFSQSLFDVHFDVAHLLKAISYCVVLLGSLQSVYHVFWQAHDHSHELESLLANVASGIIAVDQSGYIVRVNPASERMFGYNQSEMEGYSLKMLLTRPFRDRSQEYIARYLQTEGAGMIGDSSKEILGRRKDGSIFPLELAVSKARRGEDFIYIGILRDITERKQHQSHLRRAKKAAEEANRAKSHFLAKMSHELRTPLNSVIGFSNLLLKNRRGNLQPQDLTYLTRIQTNGKHLLNLINEVLDLSKIEAGRMEVKLVPVDLETMIREVVTQFEVQVGEKNLSLSAAIPDKVQPILTDPGKFRQILMNLIGNAVKFTEQGSVTVKLKTDADTGVPLSLYVSDTGIGISEGRIQWIFEPFRQGDETKSSGVEGTGLGLAVCRSLCQLMGYNLTVASRLGQGSTFTLDLEKHQDRLVDASDARPDDLTAVGDEEGQHPVGSGKGLILVIDDETDSRTLLQRQIEDLGFRARGASSGQEGLELARSLHPDLITLDLLMPGMSGWEFLRRLRADKSLKDIPVLVISVVASENRGADLGVLDLLDKPVAPSSLAVTLKQALPRTSNRIMIFRDQAVAVKSLPAPFQRPEFQIKVVDPKDLHQGVVEGFHPDLLVLSLSETENGIDFLTRLETLNQYPDLPLIVIADPGTESACISYLRKRGKEVIQSDVDLDRRLQGILQNSFGPCLQAPLSSNESSRQDLVAAGGSW